jgi:hypothetical protein
MTRRRVLRIRALCTAALCLPAAAVAQTAVSLHAAWLQEVLDLDVAGATAAYGRLASDRQAPLLDRLIATARIVELRQQGVGRDAPAPDLAIVPEVLRKPFQQYEQPEPLFERELEAGHGDRAAVREFFAQNEVPPLRPLVFATVIAAAEQQDPSAAERRQQRARFWPWSNDPARVLDRIRANDIVRAELDGNSDQASMLRKRDFPNWRPPATAADPAAAWAQAAENLATWLRDRQLTPAERALLRRLQDELTRAAATSPQKALGLLDRMPLYAERLRAGSR